MTRVVVVGAGTAGIPAALGALAAGAEVVLVDKNDRPGGVLWVSGGMTSGAPTARGRAKGIDDDAERHFEDVQRIGRGRANAGVLRLVTSRAGETIDWFESLGARFTDESPTLAGFELYSVPRSFVLDAPPEVGPWRGKVLAQLFVEELERHRDDGRLSLLLNTRVTALEHDGGRVSGCVVEGPGGTDRLAADAVVLATGGYAASQELMRRLHGDYERLITLTLPLSTGDGLALAEQAGAAIVNDDLVLPNPGGIEDPDRPGYRLEGGALPVGRPPGTAGDIWVNALGVRFIAEDEPSQAVRERAIAEQPGAVMYAIFDEPMRKGLTDEVGEWTSAKLADGRLIVSAETIDELARAAGLPAPGLAETVRSYNDALGGDDPLGRVARPKAIDTPPFHAVLTRGTTIMTFAGVSVDEQLRVLDADGRPIPGLYAAGEVLGAGQLQGAGYSSGMMIVSAVVSGRAAGEHAAAGAA